MICNHCGAEIKETYKFCNKCGARVQPAPDENAGEEESRDRGADGSQSPMTQAENVSQDQEQPAACDPKPEEVPEADEELTEAPATEQKNASDPMKSGEQEETCILVPAQELQKSLSMTEIPLQVQSGTYAQGKIMLELKLSPEITALLKRNAAVQIPVNEEAEKAPSGDDNSRNLMKRVFMFLEDGEFEKADAYCERVLDSDPYNPMAYLGKLLAELHLRSLSQLDEAPVPFDDNKNYRRCLRYADEQMAQQLKNKAAKVRQRAGEPSGQKKPDANKHKASSAFVRNLNQTQGTAVPEKEQKREQSKDQGGKHILRWVLIAVAAVTVAGIAALALFKPELFRSMLSKMLSLI